MGGVNLRVTQQNARNAPRTGVALIPIRCDNSAVIEHSDLLYCVIDTGEKC